MVKRIAPIRVSSFVLLVACAALGQSARPSADLLQRDGSNSPGAQSVEMGTWRSLPDTPSTVQPPNQAEKFPSFVDEARTSLTPSVAGINSIRRETEVTHITPVPQFAFSAPYGAVTQKDSLAGEDSYPSLLKQNLLYHPSTSSSFMGRVTDAASRILITRDDAGKKRLNTPFFLRVLGSVAIHNAYRPNSTRSASARFNDFGSTIGSGAGMNLFHEFGPGFRQMVKGHTPKFALRFGERIRHEQKLGEDLSSPAR